VGVGVSVGVGVGVGVGEGVGESVGNGGGDGLGVGGGITVNTSLMLRLFAITVAVKFPDSFNDVLHQTFIVSFAPILTLRLHIVSSFIWNNTVTFVVTFPMLLRFAEIVKFSPTDGCGGETVIFVISISARATVDRMNIAVIKASVSKHSSLPPLFPFPAISI